MENDQQKYFFDDSSDVENNIVNIVYRYIAYWKWFVLGAVLSIVIANLYLRYQVPLYEVNASILIKDDKNGGAISELSAFEDLGLLKGSNNIDNEIEVLKSRALMTLVAKELRLNVRYIIEENPIAEEKFGNAPLYIRFMAGDSSIYEEGAELIVSIQSGTTFNLSDVNANSKETYTFGQEINSSLGKIIIFATTDLQKYNLVGKNVRIAVTPVSTVVDNYRSSVKIDPVNKTSNVIVISLRDPVKEKAAAIVNNLIKQHNADAIADKNLVSKNTAEFINDRIKFITAELSDVEGEAEEFKTRHKLVDVESEAKLFLESGSTGELSILEANTQKALADYMYDYLQKHTSTSDLIPANLGLSDVAVANMITEYNKAILDRNRLLKASSEKNPVVENIDAQLAGLKKSIRESLANYRTALQIKVKELDNQESGINSKIAAVPKYEREYRIIQRQQQIKETLYLYLLQKREETNIALAVTVANAKIIDNAYSNGEPVAPKRKIIYLTALLLGIIIPVVILYILDILDNKVHGKRDIDRIGVPFLGDIPYVEAENKVVVVKGDQSSVAEAFRLLRTNVDFLMNGHIKKGKTIFVTSTLAKEGKSFVALNLAAIIAHSDKRVLLIGMDLRAPKILQYLGLDDKKPGLSNYISDPDLKPTDVIFNVPKMSNLDLLPSGAIPPNPAELLMSDRVHDLFAFAKETYDYIVVDTAPVGLVTDTLLLGKYADSVVFIVRAHYLEKHFLYVAENAHKEKKLPNMAILMNGTDQKKGYGYGYGYGYGGYGYGQERKPTPWWKRVLGLK